MTFNNYYAQHVRDTSARTVPNESWKMKKNTVLRHQERGMPNYYRNNVHCSTTRHVQMTHQPPLSLPHTIRDWAIRDCLRDERYTYTYNIPGHEAQKNGHKEMGGLSLSQSPHAMCGCLGRHWECLQAAISHFLWGRQTPGNCLCLAEQWRWNDGREVGVCLAHRASFQYSQLCHQVIHLHKNAGICTL